jgi:hypothetical protein
MGQEQDDRGKKDKYKRFAYKKCFRMILIGLRLLRNTKKNKYIWIFSIFSNLLIKGQNE